jgi:hypothetical protein
MRRYLTALFLLTITGCNPLSLTPELSNRETYRLFRQATENDTLYNIRYNPDSTFALCILNDQSELVSEPISFFIIDIDLKKKVLVSLNEYDKAHWLDSRNVRLVSYSGISNHSRELNKKPVGGLRENIFNVTSGEIKLYIPQPEK